MKQWFKLFTLTFVFLSVPISFQASTSQDSKKLALEIIASLSDDIATLIINKQQANDPQLTKICCVNLITRLADTLATVIIKMKERKAVRTVDLISDVEFNNTIEALVAQLLNKIDSCENSL
jgi:predicted transcriptional regulator